MIVFYDNVGMASEVESILNDLKQVGKAEFSYP
jgi:hypothetical protein